jgi:glucose-6-phosphate 1-dehydrogenase
MSFEYDEAFGDQSIPEAYERLLLDVLKGDASLFTRSDSIELAWALVDPILEGWSLPTAPPLAFYEPGTWGPEEADTLIRHDGYGWTMGCGEEN